MRIAFVGTSHAARHFCAAAVAKGFELCGIDQNPHLAFVSEDTPTDSAGRRDLEVIKELCRDARAAFSGILVLTSQVPPGFTRSLELGFFHQADTLRIKDAAHRALHPEMMIVGCQDPEAALPEAYEAYLRAFGAPVLKMSLEEAEFAKIAFNMTLAAQVENTNRLAAAAAKVGARWSVIADVLRHDSRIGPHAYLVPGRWQDSPHLLRDAVTLQEIQP